MPLQVICKKSGKLLQPLENWSSNGTEDGTMTIEPFLSLSHLLKISLSCYVSLSFSQTHTRTLNLSLSPTLNISFFLTLSRSLSLSLSSLTLSHSLHFFRSISLDLFRSLSLTLMHSLALSHQISQPRFSQICPKWLSISLSLFLSSLHLSNCTLFNCQRPLSHTFFHLLTKLFLLSIFLLHSHSHSLSLSHSLIVLFSISRSVLYLSTTNFVKQFTHFKPFTLLMNTFH